MSAKVVLYYANWCPHCHNFMPEWNKLIKMLNNNGIKTEQYDYVKNPSPADKEKIGGFPTIKLFYKGKSTELNRGTANEMFNNIKNITNNSNFIKGNGNQTEHFTKEDEMLLKINKIITDDLDTSEEPLSTMNNSNYHEEFNANKQAGGMFSGYNPAYTRRLDGYDNQSPSRGGALSYTGLMNSQYNDTESSYLASPQQFLNYKYNMYMQKYNLM